MAFVGKGLDLRTKPERRRDSERLRKAREKEIKDIREEVAEFQTVTPSDCIPTWVEKCLVLLDELDRVSAQRDAALRRSRKLQVALTNELRRIPKR